MAISGGGAEAATASVETAIGAPAPAFDFLPGPAGLGGVLSGPDGAAVAGAGSRPYQLTVDMRLPSELLQGGGEVELAGVSHPRDFAVDLPPGFVLDPAATPRCREAQLELGSCPPASQVGLIGITTMLVSTPAREGTPLYNMVPPPGAASNLGFNLAEFGVTGHLLGSLRAGDNRLFAEVTDLLAKYPVFGIQLQLWGDPSDPAHDAVRGTPVEPQATPFIALPSACGPLELDARADSWENPGLFVSRSGSIADLAGNPIEVEGCSLLEFDPSLSAEPTTAAADSASGLTVKIGVPQHLGQDGSTASSLKRAEVTLPPGMVINPAAVNGRGACSPAQIGLTTQVGWPSARFDDSPAGCPDAAKVGTVEALTPLLQDESGVGASVPHPLTGSIYLAQPRQNPFRSLFALYLAIEDPATGIVVKLAGEVRADPVSGQLTAAIDEIPQLPLEEFRLDFFEGPRAPFRTPSLCSAAASRAGLTPWSGTPPVREEVRFQITASPDGGPCATTSDQQPNAPRFEAGTTFPVAGRYSPFVLNLARKDGSQEFGSLNLTLPPGLTGRIAGTPYCPEAALLAAASKSGGEEAAAPSCPAGSKVGRVAIGVGAGPSPYVTEGKVYLSGPYRGAPLSLAVVTPAVAGPFDLGTVVVRVALFVDGKTGQVRAKSDPLPRILDGVPLDLRSLAVELDKPSLALNPTSCEPMSVSGEAISTGGRAAPLRSRFQVGKCASLRFRPKTSATLTGSARRGGHPGLRVAIASPSRSAAIRAVQITLPRTELLDQRHIAGICAAADLAVHDCAASSIYGFARVWTPLLDRPLGGPLRLRSSARRLPGLALQLEGQVPMELQGSVLSVHGRLRISFANLPDTPFGRLVLTLRGGRHGLLVNTGGVCSQRRIDVRIGANSGRYRLVRPRLVASACR